MVPTIRFLRVPRSCVVPNGAPFRLLVEVICSSDDKLHYQWYFNGSKIVEATSDVYIHKNTGPDDCGPYWCEVRAGEGPACVISPSARVQLKFEEREPPGSDWQHREG